MIQSISIENIGSFRDRATFSLVATGYNGKLSNVVVREGIPPTLKVAMIYGANASGKTQFILALFALRKQLRGKWKGAEGLSDLYNPFKLDLTSSSMQSLIEVQFDINNKMYLYSVKFDENMYNEEILKEKIDNKWSPIFDRKPVTKKVHSVIYYDSSEGLRVPEVASDVLVLSQYITHINDHIADVAKYLSNIQIGNGYHAHMKDYLWQEVQEWLSSDKKNRKEKISGFLNAMDVNQKDIRFPQKGDADFDNIVFVHDTYKQDEQVGTAYFSILNESQGSKWLLLIGAKIIQSIENGYPLFMDEIDACYHPQITKAIIELFQDSTVNVNNSQLVLTTHNPYLMDENSVRTDQIWFVEKSQSGRSELYNLSEFDGIEEDSPFTDWYFAHRFGGAPNINYLRNVFR